MKRMKRTLFTISAALLVYSCFHSAHAMMADENSIFTQPPQEAYRSLDSKDYNECMKQADEAFAIRCNQCEKWFHGSDAQAQARFHQCIISAEKNLADRQDSCERVEVVHESLNPNVNVNFGFGKIQEPSKEAKEFIGNVLKNRRK